MAVSVICSDHYIPVDQLAELGADIRADVRARQPHDWTFDVGAIALITQQFDDPSWRDPFTLQRNAKQGFLTKQMNWHFIGPDGYRAEVVTRGTELKKADFDALTREVGFNAFFSEAYFDGHPRATRVEKPVWYCLADLMGCVERQARRSSLEEAVLIENAKEFITSYLRTKYGMDMGLLG